MVRTDAIVLGLTLLLASSDARADEARSEGRVHVAFKSYKKARPASVYTAMPNGSYAFLCTTPCSADLAPLTGLRVIFDNDEYPHDFELVGSPNRTMTLEVRPASKGALAGGIVMTAIGGFVALIGTALAAVSAFDHGGHDDELRNAGFVTLGIGAGLTAGGIALILSRSHEPRVRQVAFAREVLPAPQAFTPLTWGFRF